MVAGAARVRAQKDRQRGEALSASQLDCGDTEGGVAKRGVCRRVERRLLWQTCMPA